MIAHTSILHDTMESPVLSGRHVRSLLVCHKYIHAYDHFILRPQGRQLQAYNGYSWRCHACMHACTSIMQQNIFVVLLKKELIVSLAGSIRTCACAQNRVIGRYTFHYKFWLYRQMEQRQMWPAYMHTAAMHAWHGTVQAGFKRGPRAGISLAIRIKSSKL